MCMRTTVITSFIFLFFVLAYLGSVAYTSDESSKQWKNKYFTVEATVNEQTSKLNQVEADKDALLDKLKKLNSDVKSLNNGIEELRKEIQAKTAELEKKNKELEVNKQISSLPFSCPSWPKEKPKAKPKTKPKKKIPYDIAPSQQ